MDAMDHAMGFDRWTALRGRVDGSFSRLGSSSGSRHVYMICLLKTRDFDKGVM